ncbi:unnamed protein product, partial [Callosobruchus maculatus]
VQKSVKVLYIISKNVIISTFHAVVQIISTFQAPLPLFLTCRHDTLYSYFNTHRFQIN